MKTFIVKIEGSVDLEAKDITHILAEVDLGSDVKEVAISDNASDDYKTVGFLLKVEIEVPKDGEYDIESYSDACKEMFENAETYDFEAMEEVDDLQVDLVAEL